MSCCVRIATAVENAELSASGVIDRKSVWDFDDPPRPGKAAGHGTGSCQSVWHCLTENCPPGAALRGAGSAALGSFGVTVRSGRVRHPSGRIVVGW